MRAGSTQPEQSSRVLPSKPRHPVYTSIHIHNTPTSMIPAHLCPLLYPLLRPLLALHSLGHTLFNVYMTIWLLSCSWLSGTHTPWSPYDPADLPRARVVGKTIIITGASSGCGEEIVRCIGERLCTEDATNDEDDSKRETTRETRVYLFVRDLAKMQSVLCKLRREWAITLNAKKYGTSPRSNSNKPINSIMDEESHGLKLIPIECDLDDLRSVRKAAEMFFSIEAFRGVAVKTSTGGGQQAASSSSQSADGRGGQVTLDVLFCNAGLCNTSVSDETRQGWERNFGVNCLAHHALIRYLSPALLNAAKSPGSSSDTGFPCVVMTNSIAAFWVRPIRGAMRYYFYPFDTVLQGKHGPNSTDSDGDRDSGSHSNSDALAWNDTAAYARSKLASLLSSRYLSQELTLAASTHANAGTRTNTRVRFAVVHPGILETGIFTVRVRNAFHRYIVKMMCYPAHTEPLTMSITTRKSKRRMGFGAVNILFAAFAKCTTQHEEDAFICEWCRIVHRHTQDQWLTWGDERVREEIEELQSQLGVWMDGVAGDV